MANLKALGANLRRRARAVETNADTLVKECTLTILQELVVDTPVDVGTAKSNWQVNIAVPASGVLPAYNPGHKGSTGTQNARDAFDAGRAALSQYTHGSAVHITNNLDYISDLNEGTSRQAPPGYVQDAVLESIGKIQQAGFTITTNIAGKEV